MFVQSKVETVHNNKHTISGWVGTVQAKRDDRALVQWDHTGYTDRHKVHYLKIVGDNFNG